MGNRKMKLFRNALTAVILVTILIQFVTSVESEGKKLAKLTRKTSAQDWGGGNIYYLDRLFVGCPAKTALEGFRLYRPSGNRLAYQYACRTRCKGLKGGKTYVGTTKPNATAGDKKHTANYLDRHRLQCRNGYAMRDFKFQRSGGSNIYYRYTCTQASCKVRQRTYTSWQSGGRNEVIYLDRQHVRMQWHHVITGFKLETHYRGGTHYRYAVDYCIIKHPKKKGKKSKGKAKKKPSKKPRKPTKKPKRPKTPKKPKRPSRPMPGAGGRGIPPPRRPNVRPPKPMISGGNGRG